MLLLPRLFLLYLYFPYRPLLADLHSSTTTAAYTIRAIGLERWKTHSPAKLTVQVVQVRIAITQKNIEYAEEQLLRTSHPSSPLFGKHWGYQQITDWFLPDPKAVRAVNSWLQESGVTSSRISQTRDGSLVFDATIKEMERILKTQYHLYSQSHDSEMYLGCDNYSIPVHLHKHIDFITPTTPFDPLALKRAATYQTVRHYQPRTEAEGHHLFEREVTPGLPSYCGDLITPACLRSLYRLPGNSTVRPHPKSNLGIVQLTAAHWLPGDLDMFFQNYAGALVGSRPAMHSINGGGGQNKFHGPIWNTEADLDMEYAMTLTSRPVLNYQIGGVGSAGLALAPNLNSLLAAFDESYCSALNNSMDHLNETRFGKSSLISPDCGTNSLLPAVVSVSYLWDEAEFPAGYLKRQCLEFLKLGLLGVTVIAASGDRGAAGWQGKCEQRGNEWSYSPSSPSSCPYVTAVGATQLPPNTKNRTREVAFSKNSTGIQSSSGGGFSNIFSTPSWQRAAVQKYLERGNHTQNDTNLFNRAGRGIPDIAANGKNYVTAIGGQWVTVDGTSASAPIVASLAVLLNDMRLRAGQSTVGFMNPVLYAYPWAMNDVKEGANFGCDQPAFNAEEGWDPVTGLGTPDFEKLQSIYQTLP